MKDHTFRINHHVTILDDVVIALVQQCLFDFSPQIKQTKQVGSEIIGYFSKNEKKGITVRQLSEGLDITVKVSISLESDITMCIGLQERIIKSINQILSLPVHSVTIKVESVHFS